MSEQNEHDCQDEAIKILFVDDEQNVLDGMKRQLRKDYPIITALGGANGLKVLEEKGPFNVVVSDMRMPGMDGAEFLKKVKEKFPNTVRVMLTGNNDMETATHAINAGSVFRFLTKPCSHEQLVAVLTSSLEQYKLVCAEQELLSKTLQGSLRALVDILATSSPEAFQRAKRTRYFVKQLVDALHLEHEWMYEIAALLSQIGCIAIPREIVAKFNQGKDLDDQEYTILLQYPHVGHDLLIHIPRLETVAKIIDAQLKDFAAFDVPQNELCKDPVVIGATMLHAILDFDSLLLQGYSRGDALSRMRKNYRTYNPVMMSMLKNLAVPRMDEKPVEICSRDVQAGMILECDVKTAKGALIARKGQEITSALEIMIKNYYKFNNIQDSVSVLVPVYNQPDDDEAMDLG